MWPRPVIAEHDERQRLVAGHVQPRQIGKAYRGGAPRRDDALDCLGAEARHAQELLAAGTVDVEREAIAVAQRPGELWIDVERQHGAVVDDLADVKTVEPHEPVGLVEPVLAQQWRLYQRQRAAGIGDRAEGGVIDAPQPV